MRNIGEYIHYFRTLASEHAAIRDFVHADSERIINQQRSDLSYPVLWLETPDVQIGADGISFVGAFIILINAPADDWRQEDLAMSLTLDIAQGILERMRSDQEDGLFEMPTSVQLDNISTLTHDNDHGWRVSYTLRRQEYLCPPPCITADLPVGAVAAFSWENSNYDNPFDIQLKNISIPAGIWNSYEWEYSVDGGATVQHSFDENPPDIIEAAGSQIVVTLRLTIVNFWKFEAKAIIPHGPGCGVSYPEPTINLGPKPPYEE